MQDVTLNRLQHFRQTFKCIFIVTFCMLKVNKKYHDAIWIEISSHVIYKWLSVPIQTSILANVISHKAGDTLAARSRSLTSSSIKTSFQWWLAKNFTMVNSITYQNWKEVFIELDVNDRDRTVSVSSAKNKSPLKRWQNLKTSEKMKTSEKKTYLLKITQKYLLTSRVSTVHCVSDKKNENYG